MAALQISEKHLAQVITLAIRNAQNGDYPFSAIIIDKTGKVLATGTNQEKECFDCTAHAEIQAIRTASKKLQTHSLEDTILIASAEPCALCYMAMYFAKIRQLVILSDRFQAKESGFDYLHSYQYINPILLAKFNILKLEHADSLTPFKRFRELCK